MAQNDSVILADLQQNERLRTLLSNIGTDPWPATGFGAGGGALDPELYARWLRNIGDQLKTSGLALFGGMQAGLQALSDGGKIWNPVYFALRAPILNSLTGITIDGIQPGQDLHGQIAQANDIHKNFAQGLPTVQATAGSQLGSLATTTLGSIAFSAVMGSRPGVEGILEERNAYNPGNRYEEGADFTIRGMVDFALSKADGAPSDDFAAQAAASQILEGDLVQRGVTRQVVGAKATTALFEQDRKTLEFKPSANVRNKAGAVRPVGGQLEKAAFARGVIPSALPGEQADGTVRTTGDQLPSTVVGDDEAYVPLVFTDLRPSAGDGYRSVYFRPFITGLSEELSPSWGDDSYFGRTDPVMVYQKTTRTVSLSFDLVPFSPEDLMVIYQKIHWLSSMVFPEYTTDNLMKNGPVCRLRVGDVIKSKGHGLSGVITSLSYDYNETPWELKRNYKVPMKVAVTVGFTVLHDCIMGLRDGVFGGILVPTQGSSATPAQTRDVGRFRGFGEPKE